MSRASLRRQLDEIAVAVTAPEPPAWAHLADPRRRLAYVWLALPAPLLEAELAVVADPRRGAIEAEAERREPDLAAGARELDDAIAAHDRGEPLVLPRPADAIAAALRVLFGSHNIVPNAYGSTNRRTGYGVPPVAYDLGTIDGAAEVVIDAWAYRAWLLDRSLPELWANRVIDDGLAWYRARQDDGDS